MIQKLRYILTRKDKKVILMLILFSIFISLIETIGISIIMPFISIAMDFTLIESNKYYQYLYNFFGFSTPKGFIIAFGVCLVVFYIFRSAINLYYNYMLNKFSQGRYHLIAYRLFSNYMGLSYKDFVKKNTSVLTKSLVHEAQNLTGLIQSFLFLPTI